MMQLSPEDRQSFGINSNYVATTEAILKIIELVFGGGAWGVVATNRIALLSGPFSFFLWVSVTCWVLTLVTYLFQLFKIPTEKQSLIMKKDLPRIGDVFMNFLFTLLYIAALVVFSVYAIGKQQWLTSPAIMVIVMSFFALITHMAHGVTIITRIILGREKWKNKKGWIWNDVLTKEETRRKKYRTPSSLHDGTSQISSPVHLAADPKLKVKSPDKRLKGSNVSISAPINQSSNNIVTSSSSIEGDNDVIYEDVPIEKGQMQYYNYNENNSNNKSQKSKNKKPNEADDGAYLNPVFSTKTNET